MINESIRCISQNEIGSLIFSSQAVHVYLHIDVNAVVDEQLEAQHAAGGRCGQVQWRAAVVVGLSDVSATVDQFGGHCVVAIQAGHVESRVAENVCVVSLLGTKKWKNRWEVQTHS